MRLTSRSTSYTDMLPDWDKRKTNRQQTGGRRHGRTNHVEEADGVKKDNRDIGQADGRAEYLKLVCLVASLLLTVV